MAAIKNGTERAQSLTIFYDNKSIFDDISLLHLENEFVDYHPDRKNIIGSLPAKDYTSLYIFCF